MATFPPGIHRLSPPQAGALKPFRFPHFLRTRLANGLAVRMAVLSILAGQ